MVYLLLVQGKQIFEEIIFLKFVKNLIYSQTCKIDNAWGHFIFMFICMRKYVDTGGKKLYFHVFWHCVLSMYLLSFNVFVLLLFSWKPFYCRILEIFTGTLHQLHWHFVLLYWWLHRLYPAVIGKKNVLVITIHRNFLSSGNFYLI